MRDKACPVCGDELAALPWGSGLVWQCGAHGVKEWWFEEDAAFAPPRPDVPTGFDDRAAWDGVAPLHRGRR